MSDCLESKSLYSESKKEGMRERYGEIHVSKDEALVCLWKDCGIVCDNAEVLYNHLCNSHVGRISKNNLCLTCHWDNCNASYGKRDHITSHIRIHTPLKPYSCSVCGKSFKRTQDLKKHGRTHMNTSKLSYEAASPDNISAKVSYEQNGVFTVHPKSIPSPEVLENVPTPAFSSLSSRESASPTSSPNTMRPYNFGSTPTYQPGIGLPAMQPRMNESVYPCLPRWAPGYASHIATRVPEAMSTQENVQETRSFGNESLKRPRSAVSDFWSDVQSKKMAPMYDNSMMERLDDLLWPQFYNLNDLNSCLTESMNAIQGVGESADPRYSSVMNPANTNLQDVNAWLLQLGNSMSLDLSAMQGQQSNFAETLSQYDLDHIPGADLVLPPAVLNTKDQAAGSDVGSGSMPVFGQPQDKGFSPIYRQVQPLTRMPSAPHEDTIQGYGTNANPTSSSARGHGCESYYAKERHHGIMYPKLPSSREEIQTPSSTSAATSMPKFMPNDGIKIRQRHMQLVLNLLLALNKNKFIHPETGHVLPMGRMLMLRRTDPRNRLSTMRQTLPLSAIPPKPTLSQSTNSRLRNMGAARETKRATLPSISQLLSNVDMD